MNILNIKLEGLTCEACARIVSKKFKTIDGVEDVLIDLVTGNAEVKSCHPLTVQELETSLAETHFSIIK